MNQLRSSVLVAEFIAELRDTADFIGLDPLHVNSQRPGGNTPLKVAAVRGNALLVAALLEAGADVNAQNEDSMTALHHAVAQGHLGAAAVLLRHGADATVKDRYGNLAEHYAASDDMRRLLRAGGSTQ